MTEAKNVEAMLDAFLAVGRFQGFEMRGSMTNVDPEGMPRDVG